MPAYGNYYTPARLAQFDRRRPSHIGLAHRDSRQPGAGSVEIGKPGVPIGGLLVGVCGPEKSLLPQVWRHKHAYGKSPRISRA